MTTGFSSADWLALLGHFLSLSLLAIGGSISTAPEMHNYLVNNKGWLTDGEFTASIALAQAAPGPNVLFIALLGWNVGLNAGGGPGAGAGAWWMALGGVGVAMVGILVPSTTLTFAAARWGHRNRERTVVRAFKQGMAPIVVALLLATGWILTPNGGGPTENWRVWLLASATTVVVWRTRIHLLWLLGAGALLGALGYV